MRSIALFALLCCCLAGVVSAATPPAEPPKAITPSTFRPYPSLPMVLFYENYETNLKTDQGSLAKGDPILSGQACKLGIMEWAKNDKVIWTIVPLDQTQMRIPYGFQPKDIFIHVNVWSEVPGIFVLKIIHQDGDYETLENLPKPKTWYPITVKLSELRNKAAKAVPEHSAKTLEIHFRPKDKSKHPVAYVDDVMFTLTVPPAQVIPQLTKLQKADAELLRSPDKDGFVFTSAIRNSLKGALKRSAKKAKAVSVVVAGATGEETQALAKAIEAQKTGFSIVTASDGEGAPIGGMSGMRLFLPYNTEKSAADYVLMNIGWADAAEDRAAAHIRLVLERALAVGSIPIVCLPPPMPSAPESGKVDAFRTAVRSLCDQMSVPTIDGSFALKGITAFDDKKLTPAGVDAIAKLSALALKHVKVSVEKND